MLASFVRYLKTERRYSPLTVRNYQRDLERFFKWLDIPPSAGKLDRITKEDIRNWIIYRTDDEAISPRSMNRELSSLRCFFDWLQREQRIVKNPTHGISVLRTSHRLPAFVSESRMQTIVESCEEESSDFEQERDALVILLFYTCGIRLAELVGINRDDFSADMRSLRIRGKGDKERLVPIMDFVREKILRYLDLCKRQNICIFPEKALILSRKGARISRTAVYRLVHRRLTEAGVPGKKSPHVLRHTFATHLLNEDADMREIQELMGHASLTATQVYTHNSIARLRAVYEQAHPREQQNDPAEKK